jgi:cholesterol oxidase
VFAPEAGQDFSRGVAITSILHTDEHSHLEPVRYGQGSNFYKFLVAPRSLAKHSITRALEMVYRWLRSPRTWLRQLATQRFSEDSQILLYMRTLEGSLALRLGRSAFTGFRRGLVTHVDDARAAPSAHLPEAFALAEHFARKIGGVVSGLFSETLTGAPTTAHILGGACMGKDATEGVIDHHHEVFGYPGLYVIDGAAVSANPGVNPSLTITALAERAMSFVPPANSPART